MEIIITEDFLCQTQMVSALAVLESCNKKNTISLTFMFGVMGKNVSGNPKLKQHFQCDFWVITAFVSA